MTHLEIIINPEVAAALFDALNDRDVDRPFTLNIESGSVDAAIANAVAAEREAIADTVLMSNDTRANLSAAIRARKQIQP